MQTRPLTVANQIFLILFFVSITAGLFTGLGQPGPITAARLYTSVSLYLILGIVWFAVYRLIGALHTCGGRHSDRPGSRQHAPLAI
jgi:hypothetical protein